MEEILSYYKKCLQNYANFNGRARRKEYWMFFLANVIIGAAISFIVGFVSDKFATALSSFYSLAILIPSIAVGVRRLHDLGKSGKLYFLIFIPLVGAVILLYWAAQPGQTGDNQYGSDPKETLEVV